MKEAIVLAGGFGTRLRQVVSDVPKPMAPIGDRPFLEVLLNSLASKGFNRIVLSVGFMAEKITNYFGVKFAGMELVYEIEAIPLGTGGAIAAAMKHCQSDHIYIFNGDTFLDLEIQEIELAWQNNHRPIIVVREVPDTNRYGRIELRAGLVKNFLDKGIDGPGLINAGCYIFRPDALSSFSSGTVFSIESDFLMRSIRTCEYDGFVTQGLFIDIGVPDDYKRAQHELRQY
jgi:D-glycero-alpha-D-manno-heptose 1-phosphate guanylyltransferase